MLRPNLPQPTPYKTSSESLWGNSSRIRSHAGIGAFVCHLLPLKSSGVRDRNISVWRVPSPQKEQTRNEGLNADQDDPDERRKQEKPQKGKRGPYPEFRIGTKQTSGVIHHSSH